MFVGHALVAFALVGQGAVTLGVSKRRALALAVLAGAFATVPDIDISYALVGAVTAATADQSGVVTAFWQTGNVVHRSITHSLLVSIVAAIAVGLWVAGRRNRTDDWRRSRLAFAGVSGLCLALLGTVTVVSGPVGLGVSALFLVAALGIAEVAFTHTETDGVTTGVVALVALCSHPFGDLLTGEPPALLYPLDVVVFTDRITLHGDATAHLLGAFGFELLAVWLGVAVCYRLTDRSLLGAIQARAMVGVAYAVSVFVVPAPTLDVAYPFVFSILAVGVVGTVPSFRRDGRSLSIRVLDRWTSVPTALAAVTVAGVVYALAYLAL